jgi:hypothetical protein
MRIAKKRCGTELSSTALHHTFEYFLLRLKTDYRHGSLKSLGIRRFNYETIIRLRQVCRSVRLSDEELDLLWYELYALRPHNKLNIVPFGQSMSPNTLKSMNTCSCNDTDHPSWVTKHVSVTAANLTWLHTFNNALIDFALAIERTPSNKPFRLHGTSMVWSNGPLRKVRMLKTLAGAMYKYLKCQSTDTPWSIQTCHACFCDNKLPPNPSPQLTPIRPHSSVYSILYQTIKLTDNRTYWIRLLDAITVMQCERMFDVSNGTLPFVSEERINASFCSRTCYWSFMKSFLLPADTFQPRRVSQLLSLSTNANVVKLHADDGIVRDKGVILDNLTSALQRNVAVCSELKRRRQLSHMSQFVTLIRGVLALDTMILMCAHQLMLTQKVVAPNIPGRSFRWRNHTGACTQQFIDNCTSSRTVVRAFQSNKLDGILHCSKEFKHQALVEWCRQHASVVFVRRIRECRQ